MGTRSSHYCICKLPMYPSRRKGILLACFWNETGRSLTCVPPPPPSNAANMMLVSLDFCLIKTVLSAEGTQLHACSLPEWYPCLSGEEKDRRGQDFVSYTLPAPSCHAVAFDLSYFWGAVVQSLSIISTVSRRSHLGYADWTPVSTCSLTVALFSCF